ncbi:MAG: DUF1569 domain-containing protein, partial [Bacteroidota bacterium]
MRKNIFNEADYQAILARLNQVSKDSQVLWGKMSSAQIMAHNTKVFAAYTGDVEIKVSWVAKLMKGVIAKTVLGDKPYGKSSPTLPIFVVDSELEFDQEKDILLEKMKEFRKTDESYWQEYRHPLFGQLSQEKIGWAMYKHLD